MSDKPTPIDALRSIQNGDYPDEVRFAVAQAVQFFDEQKEQNDRLINEVTTFAYSARTHVAKAISILSSKKWFGAKDRRKRALEKLNTAFDNLSDQSLNKGICDPSKL